MSSLFIVFFSPPLSSSALLWTLSHSTPHYCHLLFLSKAFHRCSHTKHYIKFRGKNISQHLESADTSNFKTITRYHYTPTKMNKMKIDKTQYVKTWNNWNSQVSGKNVRWCNNFGNEFGSLWWM